MQPPPFRLATAADAVRPGGVPLYRAAPGDDCCDGSTPAPVAPPPAGRARLSDLDPHIHCSVIGTCLSTAELRKLLPRHADIDGARASELDIHHTAVQFAGARGPCSKALHKALDERHAATLKRFGAAASAEQLATLWVLAMKSGDVPGAYWALMTHRHVTPTLRQQAFGEVHMLSHLVGAANRAYIRRLVALEQENAESREHAERQQQRLNQMAAQIGELRRELDAAQTAAQHAARVDTSAERADAAQQLAALQQSLEARDRLVALQTLRRQEVERELLLQRETEHELQGRLERQQALVQALQAEVAALETTLPTGPATADGTGAPGGKVWLQGRRVVYVGGRPSTAPSIKAAVAAAGGEILIHDGGIEDRKGLLAAALPRADAVVFPVDCIDHDSMATLKKVFQRHGVAFYPLRSASVASFLACVAQWGAAPQAEGRPLASRFCVRHG